MHGSHIDDRRVSSATECSLVFTPGGGDSHMKVTGMLVGKLELTP